MTTRNGKKPVTVAFVALGCPKNIVDAEAMLARIGQAEYVLSPDPDNADVVIINTCGFIAPAKEEAIAAIRQAVAQKKTGCIRKIVVTGCLSQRMGQSLADQIPQIDAVVGLSARDRIAEIIKDCLRIKKTQAPKTWLTGTDNALHDDRGRLLITPQHWAYLRISEGCNRRCAFCTIPAIRGPFRSKPLDILLDEARELVNFGVVELNLIAQDSSNYGNDLKMQNGLNRLLEELEKIPSLRWIRLMYLYPANISDALIETIAESSKIVPYIDMPVQHINDAILKSMRRNDTKENTKHLIEKLRRALPDVALRSTIIVGYPGETDDHFAELLDFVKWAQFDALGCFPYFPESGTAAAEMPGQIPPDVKNHRVDELMRLQQELVFDKMDKQIGRKHTILIDETYDDHAVGRYYGQAPHIDSVCRVENCTAHTGRFIDAEITGRDDHDYLARQIDT